MLWEDHEFFAKFIADLTPASSSTSNNVSNSTDLVNSSAQDTHDVAPFSLEEGLSSIDREAIASLERDVIASSHRDIAHPNDRDIIYPPERDAIFPFDATLRDANSNDRNAGFRDVGHRDAGLEDAGHRDANLRDGATLSPNEDDALSQFHSSNFSPSSTLNFSPREIDREGEDKDEKTVKNGKKKNSKAGQCEKFKKYKMPSDQIRGMIERFEGLVRFGSVTPTIPLKFVSEYVHILRLIENQNGKKYKFTHFSENLASLDCSDKEQNFFQPQLIDGKTMIVIGCGPKPYSKIKSIESKQILIFQFLQDSENEREIVKRICNCSHLHDVSYSFCTLATVKACNHRYVASLVFSLYVFYMFHESKLTFSVLISHMKRTKYENMKEYVLTRLQSLVKPASISGNKNKRDKAKKASSWTKKVLS